MISETLLLDVLRVAYCLSGRHQSIFQPIAMALRGLSETTMRFNAPEAAPNTKAQTPTGAYARPHGFRPSRQMWLVGAAIVLVALALRAIWAAPPRSVRWDEPTCCCWPAACCEVKATGCLACLSCTGRPLRPSSPRWPCWQALRRIAALTVWHVLAGALACGLLFGLASDVTGDWRTGAAGWPADGRVSLAGGVAALLGQQQRDALHGAAAGRAVGIMADAARRQLAGWAGRWAGLQREPISCAPRGCSTGCSSWDLRCCSQLQDPLTARRSAFGLSFLVLAIPYLAYLRRVTGRLMLSGKTGITATLGAAISDLGSAAGQ